MGRDPEKKSSRDRGLQSRSGRENFFYFHSYRKYHIQYFYNKNIQFMPISEFKIKFRWYLSTKLAK